MGDLKICVTSFTVENMGGVPFVDWPFVDYRGGTNVDTKNWEL